jgi:O-antigen/teichoic acid export membrane protein
VFLIAKGWLADSLIGIGLVYTLTPIIVFIVMSIVIFTNNLYEVRPSFYFFRKDKVESLFSLGIQFFIIHIATIVIFQTDTMIITHILSPKEVTPYNIAFRYFGVLTMVAGIIMTPFWSAYTEAAAKNDILWIKKMLKKQLKLFMLFFLFTILLYLCANTIIKIWMQKEIQFTNNLLFGMAIFTILSVWNNIFSFVLGGLSLIRLGTIITSITALMNIPLSIYCISILNGDAGGVIYATAICIGITALISPIQVHYFLYSNKKNPLLTNLLR